MHELITSVADKHKLTITNMSADKSKKDNQIHYQISTGVSAISIHIIQQQSTLYIMPWNIVANYPIELFKADKTTLTKQFEAIVASCAMYSKSTPADIAYVESVLGSAALGSNSFAQSLSKQLADRGQLSPKQVICVVGPSAKGSLKTTATQKDKKILDRYFAISDKNGIPVAIAPRTYSLVATKGETVKLLPTKEHKYFQYSFPMFNPVQSLVKPFTEVDCNVVIGANTSAGKTICAEMLMDHTLSLGKKVIYMSPLKSLTQEKYTDWKERYPDKSIEIMTGDYSITPERAAELENTDIICMTSEMLDSRTRKIKSEHNNWIYKVGIVIMDEAHILDSESRGHPAEVGLMRFTENNDSARIVMLSATMPNVEEFGTWLTNLNAKKTEVIFCDWRPVVLNMAYIEYDTKGNYFDARDRKIQLSIDQVLKKPKEKFLVFVHDKNTGREVVKQLSKNNVTSVFHNADLNIKDRLAVESRFKTGDLRVVVATSTLAWGVNLPARNVVIVGVHRGINEVDELDIIQEIGRAGRFGIDDAGFVFLIVPKDSTDTWKRRITFPKPVTSSLKQIEVLAFHVLGELYTENVSSAEEISAWFDRSLAAVQDAVIDNEYVTHVIKDLNNMKMIAKRRTRNSFTLTGLGTVSALMYYSPYDIHDWHSNFRQVFSERSEDEKLLAWAVADVSSNRMSYIPKFLEDDARDLKTYLNSKGIDAAPNVTSISSVIAAEHCLKGMTPHASTLKAAQHAFMYDTPRMMSAIEMIDSMYARWEHNWEDFRLKLTYGVDEQLLDFVRLPGIGRKRAITLYEMGYNSLEDITNSTVSELASEFTKTVSQVIMRNAKKITNKRNS